MVSTRNNDNDGNYALRPARRVFLPSIDTEKGNACLYPFPKKSYVFHRKFQLYTILSLFTTGHVGHRGQAFLFSSKLRVRTTQYLWALPPRVILPVPVVDEMPEGYL